MTDTGSPWVEAGGDHQIPFIRAARQLLHGKSICCPKCGKADLRFYFHTMKPELGQGTLWVWCPACRTKCHLPRITPSAVPQTDPFANLSLTKFAEVELDPRESFQDRLNRMWEEGSLLPNANTES